MNHILFESAREVCFFPKLLGLETVIVDYSEELCKDCMAIILNYNDRINNYELALSIPRTSNDLPEDPLAPSRGFMIGVALATVFWFVFYLVGKLVFGW